MIGSQLSPEQWDQAFELFDSLLDKPDAERRSILQNQCAGKPALRAAVEDLLRAHDSKGSFLDASGLAWDTVSPVRQLQPGQKLAQYRLVELIGQGGMGIVWKAEDQRLRRVVALKFINAALVNHPSEKARFLREAQAAAKLHHPNICTVYEINEADGIAWIAMAFLDGQTVAQRISAGPLDIREALDIVAQTASGLDNAHRCGVLHRDVKPANLMLTQGTSSRWHVTLMDFGLARLLDRSQLTQGRFLGGTIAYMAPEQVAAAPCDGRADLWALGAVLYEMISGRRPFVGPVDQVLIDLIANREPPPLTSLRTGVPVQMDWIIEKALAKKPDQRYQSAADLIADLRRLSERLDADNTFVSTQHPPGRRLPPAPASRSPRLRWIWIGTVLLAAIAAVAFPVGFRLAQRDPFVEYTFQQITFDGGIAWRPALSPDGKLLAYASDRSGDGNLDIWVQQLDSVSPPLRVTRDPGEDTEPEFTADGASIVFRSTRRNGGLYIIPSLGGGERWLGPKGSNPKISRDGKFLVYFSEGHRLILMSLQTGKAEILAPELLETTSPVWLPDSRRVLARGLDSKTEVWDWYLLSIEDGSYVRVGALEQLRALKLNEPEPLGWVPAQNRVVFSARAGLSSALNLWEIGISPRTGKLQDSLRRLTTGANETHAHISRAGSVALAIKNSRVDIWSVPLDGPDHTSRGGLQRLTTRATQNLGAAISSDGAQLAFSSG